MGKSGRKEKGVSKENLDKLHQANTDWVLWDGTALSGSDTCGCLSALVRQLLLLPLSPMWPSVFCL